jgi:alkanesulfonate monooxygenase SsuD/methylene tetrahydromethanopterin reductase-like flavin-dependent oxidoreductase (luciferase family)
MFEHFTDEQFACWLAGFFDGEGCVYLPKGSGVALIIANTNEAVIRAIHGRLGIGVVTTTTFDNPRWKTKYTWETKRYDEAGAFLRAVRPFLTIKAPKADDALAKIDAALARQQAMLDRNRAIVEAVDAGGTHAEVAKRFGIHRTGVTALVSAFRRTGAVVRNRRAPRKSLSSHVTSSKIPLAVRTRQTSRTSAPV